MDIKRALPRPELRSVVRSFEERRADLGSAVLTWPVAARPHQILNIHLAEPYRVRIDGGPANTTPEVSVVGPQTYRGPTSVCQARFMFSTFCFNRPA
jgi:hypothetical protein